jgi:PUA domain protein
MKKTLRKSEIKELNLDLHELYGIEDFFSKKDLIEVDDHIIFNKGSPVFFYNEKKLAPTLKLLLQSDFPIKKIVVDMGAVKHVASGADIMRPGIVEFDAGLEKDDFVVIVDEKNRKPLAIGLMLFSGSDAESAQSGKIVKTIHYVGDDLWKA